MTNYAFIDASNLFYGGLKSLGWKIDYKKLLKYLKIKYKVTKVYYYAGVELCGYKYSLFDNKIELNKLSKFLEGKNKINELNRVKFYLKLEEFGYNLVLKPVKIFKKGNKVEKKANCDVDLTFHLMKYLHKYSNVLVLSGDGDFTIVLKYIQTLKKKVYVLARGERTAKEIKQLVGGNFRDFGTLRSEIEFFEKTKK